MLTACKETALEMECEMLQTTKLIRLWERTQPPMQWIPKVKQPGREADLSPPCNVGSRMLGAIPLPPQYVFMAWCLVKQWNNLTFTFYSN
jgi:hypothetical protein